MVLFPAAVWDMVLDELILPVVLLPLLLLAMACPCNAYTRQSNNPMCPPVLGCTESGTKNNKKVALSSANDLEWIHRFHEAAMWGGMDGSEFATTSLSSADTVGGRKNNASVMICISSSILA
jgi:hypothetical protein